MKQNFFVKFLLSVLIFLIVPLGAEASYKDEGKDGSSEANAYIIDSIADLQELQTCVNDGTEPIGKYYKLAIDLNLSPYTTWEPIGYDSTKPFKGHFDGNGKILYVSIKRNDYNSRREGAAIFGYLEPGSNYTVKNLTVSGTIESGNFVAGIAEVLVNGIIDNCHFTGTIDGYNSNDSRHCRAGGIVAAIQNGTIKNCNVKKGFISANNQYDNDELPYAGGIAAVMYGGSIENCNVIEGSTIEIIDKVVDYVGYAGGIVGYANLNISNTEGIKNCIFSGTIKLENPYTEKIVTIGGIIGSLSGGIVEGCKVLSGSRIYSQYERLIDRVYQDQTRIGGIAGELLMGGVVQGCTVESGVYVSMQKLATGSNTPSLGGIIGRLDTGTVKSNNFYGILSSTGTSHIGGIIGNITGAVTTISGNKFSNATNGIGFDASGFPSDEGCTHVYAPSITTESLSSGKTGTEYSKTLKATGTKTITWSISSGSLPTGLSLSSAGKITGTPTKTGNFTFTVKAENAVGSDTKELSIKIAKNSSVTIEITTSSLNNAVVGKAYSAQLAATSNPASTLTWSISSGTLPNGLSLSSDGKLTGTPTASAIGNFIFTVKAAYSSYSATKEFSMTVEPKITIKTKTLKDAVEDKSYSVTLSATGASTITWKKSSGTLPAGLKVTSAGKITGKPTETGTFTFKVKASYSSISYATKQLSLTVKPKVTVTTSSLSKGSVGTAYTATLTATGNPKITWSITKGALPNGLALAKSGQIIGIPEEEGTFSFTVKAENSYSSATKSLKLVIKTGTPAITTSSLANGTVGEAYNVTLKASGTAPFTWSRAEGSLPNGLGLSTAGRIIGVPTQAGRFSFTLKVTNGIGTATKPFEITIASEANTTSKAKDKTSDNEAPVIDDGLIIVNERDTASLSESILNEISNDKCVIAAILPEITVSEYNLYLFENVSLDSKVPEGWKLNWHSFPKNSEAVEDIAEFFDDEGETLTEIPSSRVVNVNASLKAGTYSPVITAVQASDSSENEESSNENSSGCNTGLIQSWGLLFVGFLIFKRMK